MALTPSQRSLRARVAAASRWANEDPVVGTAAARAKSPSQIEYFERQVDPDGVLPTVERRRRAECAKKAYFARLQLASSRARRRKRSE